MTLSLSVDEVSKLSSALHEDTSQSWFLSVLSPSGPRAPPPPRPSLNSVVRTHQYQNCQVPYPHELGPRLTAAHHRVLPFIHLVTPPPTSHHQESPSPIALQISLVQATVEIFGQ